MTDAPVFILSAGWRSGSTLLQRMITGSGEVLVWGEAGGALTAAEDMLERYKQMLGPGKQRFRHGYGGNGAAQWDAFRVGGTAAQEGWIASMNPPEQYVVEALRKALLSIYEPPATALGYKRWGVKEVESGIETAEFLRLVFPNAQFITLVRDPISALRSIKQRNWIDHNDHEDPLGFFIDHWGRLAAQFHDWEGGHRLRYEDLTGQPTTVTALGDFLGIGAARMQLTVTKHADWPATRNDELSWSERRRIRSKLKEPMRAWGYA